MLKNRGVLMLISFLLVVFGVTALIMMLVGVNWAFMTFLDYPGRAFGMVIRILMIMVGVVLFVAAQTDWEKEKRESEKKD